MFFGGKQESHGYGGGPDTPGDGSGNGHTGEPPGPKSLGFWLCIIIPNLFLLISFVLNAFCFLLMVVKSQCTFTSPLNLLMMTFLLTMAYNTLNQMVCSILGEVLGMEGQSMIQFSQISDIFSSYFSVGLLFLVGMNRASVYCFPWLVKNLFPRKRLILFLILCLIVTIALSIFCYYHCGMSRSMGTDGYYDDYVSDMVMLTVFSYISYAIALSSTVFYLRVYLYLKEQRTGAVHDKTKQLLDRAEKANCRQGAFILFLYSISLVFFILADTIETTDEWHMVLHVVQEVVQSLPGLGIPLSLIFFCPEMKYTCRRLRAGKSLCKCKDKRSSADSGSTTRRTTLSLVSTY